MNEILSTLNLSGEAVIKTDELPEFLAFCLTQPDYYSFRYEYSESFVKINLIGKDTVIKL